MIFCALVYHKPRYALRIACLVRVFVPDGPDREERALVCAAVTARVCLVAHGIVKET